MCKVELCRARKRTDSTTEPTDAAVQVRTVCEIGFGLSAGCLKQGHPDGFAMLRHAETALLKFTAGHVPATGSAMSARTSGRQHRPVNYSEKGGGGGSAPAWTLQLAGRDAPQDKENAHSGVAAAAARKSGAGRQQKAPAVAQKGRNAGLERLPIGKRPLGGLPVALGLHHCRLSPPVAPPVDAPQQLCFGPSKPCSRSCFLP